MAVRGRQGAGWDEMDFLAAMAVATFMVMVSILTHYEFLRLTANHLGDLPVPPRFLIVFVVFAAFAAHTVEIWLWAGAFWLVGEVWGLGRLQGEPVHSFTEWVYFSAETYTSLGIGDHYPSGALRLLTGAETLNGLVLIGWSASFTYLAMSKYWPLHARRGAPRKKVRLIDPEEGD